MNLDTHPVPECIVAALKAALASLDDDALRTLMVAHPEFGTGFRPGKAPLSLIRTRATAAFERFTELPPDYRAALQSGLLTNSLISVLSEKAIDTTAPQLVLCFGTGLTLASMLLDDRQAVRDKAIELGQVWDGIEPTPEDARAAAAQLCDTLAPFLGHLSQRLSPRSIDANDTAAPEPLAPAMPAAAPVTGKAGRNREMESELRTWRQDANRLRQELDAVTTERDREAAQANALAQMLAAAATKRDALAAELSALKSNLGGHVDAIVARRMDERLFPWLRPAETLQSAVTDPAGTDLLARAQALLQRQADTDLHFGLLTRLRAELAQCESIRASLLSARSESLNPLPELARVARELEQRMTRIRALLGQHATAKPGADSPALVALTNALAAATSIEAVASLRQSLDATEPLGLLSEKEMQCAYELIRDATSRRYAKASLGSDWAAGRVHLSDLPLYAMQASLARSEECHLVVDGHNVLFGLPSMFGEHYEQGVPGARARTALESALVTLGGRHPTLKIDLWFDGDVLADHTASANVQVHYSGGVGADRADASITGYLTHLRTADPGSARAVVTADRAVIEAAKAVGAMGMRAGELALWLK